MKPSNILKKFKLWLKTVKELRYHPNYIKHINDPDYDPKTGRVIRDNGLVSVCDKKLGIVVSTKIGFKKPNFNNIETVGRGK